jgi:cytidylate kinase
MLHSEDADINEVIREIISLDKRAIAIKKRVASRADEMMEQTKNDIKEREKAEIENAQKQAKKIYEIEIEKANIEHLAIINSMDKELLKVRYRYDEKKEEKAIEVLERLFKTSTESS